MAEPNASTLIFNGDSTGAVAALHAVDEAAKRTAASVKGTGAALGGIGAEADVGVEKAVAATKRFESQLKRLNLELESGGRNTAAYIEGRAKLAGADTAALAPLIAQYDQIKAKQAIANSEFTKAGKVMTEYGMTVKGTSAALRQVPAQFTDIIVSLQGGQAPLTVLLQQGGQLKDVFGGVGNAAKALGGYILGLVNPLSLAAAAAGTLAIAYLQGSKEAEAYNKALITTGNAAGLTSSQLGNMAKSVAQATGGTLGAAAEALAGLAGSTGIASEQFERIATVAAQMEKTTGQAVSETVKQFSELGNDPVKASLKLTETTRFLTAEVYNQIKALVDQGRELEAGVIAQNAWANAIATRTPALLDNLGLVQRAWNSIMGAAKGAWDAMLNVGRPVDPVDKTLAALESARAKLIDLEKLGNGKNTMIERANVERLIQGLEQKQLVMQGELRTKELLAGMEKDGIKRQENSIALAVASDKFAGKQVLMQREIAQARALYAGSDKSETDLKNLDASLAGIAKKYEETTKAAKTVREQVNKAAQEDIAAFKAMAALKTKAEGDEMKRAEDSIAASEKARNAVLLSHAKEMESLTEKAQKLEDEVAMYGLSKDAIEALTTARMLDRIEVLKSFDNSDEEIARIKELIAARQRLAAAGTAKDLKDETAKAAKDAAAEWKKTSDQINSTLTDALMRGFESGKGFAKTLRDTVVNMFKTMVLRPIISAVMSPISGAITGAMGLSGAASAATGVAGGAATGLAGTLAGFAATAASWGTAAGAGFMATLGGSTIAGGGAAGILATGGAAGASTAGSIGAAAPYALAAVAVLAAFGAFRTTKKVGEGITGTLGGDNQSLNSFEEMRKSGYLFGGPKYWDELKALDATMAKAINTDFDAIKTAAKGAASALGLSADSVAGFSKAIRLTFTGDKAKDEALYKEYMSGASEDLARTIIGSYKETVATVIDEIISGGGGEGGDITYSQVERQVKTSTYTPSEFARDGETASQTLQRLATSITLVNANSDLLGNKLTEVGLKGANTASLLIDAFGGAERYAAQMGAYYQNFYTQEEQRAKLIENTSEAFTALGKTMPVLDGGARAAYRSMVELAAGQDMSVESNRTAYASLLALQGPMNELAPTFDAVTESAKVAVKTLAELAKDALDIGKTNADEAYATLERAVGAQLQIAEVALSVAQEQIDAITSIFDTLKTNVQSLYGSVDSTRAMQATQGQAFITQALATAQASGYLPDSVELADAIAGAMGGITDAQYASQSDADFNRLVLAGKLSALQYISGDQLTEAQKALKAAQDQITSLDAILQTARDQIDVANGIDISVISVVDAVNLVNASVQTLVNLQAANADASRMESIKTYIQSVYSTDSPALEKAGLEKISTTAKEYGVTMADAARSMGLSLQSVQALYAKFGVTWQGSLGLISSNGGLTAHTAGGSASAPASGGGLTFGGGGGGGGQSVSATRGRGTTDVGAAYYVQANSLYDSGSSYASLGQSYITSPDAVARLDNIATGIAAIGVATPDAVAQLAATAQQYGVSMQDLATASGYKIADVQALFAGQGIPAFSQGINRVPYDMTARIHEGEAVVPAQFNPFNPNARQAGNDTSRTDALIEGLTKEVQRLQSLISDGNTHARRTADTLDNVTEGGSNMRTVAL